jgi:lipoprotein NlpI
MIKPLLLSCVTIALLSGCSMFKRDKAREETQITAEVQETFRKRWVDKRTADLVTQGTAAEAARAQAEREFNATYDFSRTPPKR